MLAQNFHINNSSFTYIPNPTPDRWDKRSLSLEKLLEAFKEHFEQDTGTNRNPAVAAVVQRHTDEILRHYSEKDGAERLLCLRVLHMALEDMDEILTGKPKEPVPQAPATPVVQESAVQVVVCGDGQEENIIHNMRRRMVQDVLRSHIQEVLRLLNDRDERSADAQSLYVPDRIPGSPPLSRYHDRSRHTMPRFDDMDDAGPDERQHRFMDVYFDVVRPRVVPRAAHSTSRRASVVVAGRPQSLPNLRGERLSIFADAAASISRPASSNGSAFDLTKDDATTGVDGSDGGDEDITSQNGDDTANDDGESHVKPEGRPAVVIPLAMQAVSHDDVWCVLVFRMICWLMMHDFHRLDIQVSKSELLGSRMPVYIA
jgi:DNA-binding transcriptional MerR regulator